MQYGRRLEKLLPPANALGSKRRVVIIMSAFDPQDQIFINCPFDSEYLPLFRALVFTISKCGYRPRCALEDSDSSQNRLDKIMSIIDECGLGLHDISRTEPDQLTQLPRFNMPFELGLFLGARRWGQSGHREKKCLILDQEPYRYRKFISDIAGQDPEAHDQNPQKLVTVVRDWLSSYRPRLMSGSLIWQEYEEFLGELPALCADMKLVADELTFSDYAEVVYGRLEDAEAVEIAR